MHTLSLIRRWISAERVKLKEGTVLASIYIMDMVDEHFQHWGGRREIEKVLNGK